MKPDYGSQNTLDLATIAVKMEKSGKVHSILVGALKSKDPLLFKVVGSVQPTMKRLDRERLFKMLKGDEGGYRDNRIPDWVDYMAIDKNLKFIHLNNICVVEIRASGLMRGYLRFPSIVGIRADKDVLDVDTFEMVQDYENVSFQIKIYNYIPFSQLGRRLTLNQTKPLELRGKGKSRLLFPQNSKDFIR